MSRGRRGLGGPHCPPERPRGSAEQEQGDEVEDEVEAPHRWQVRDRLTECGVHHVAGDPVGDEGVARNRQLIAGIDHDGHGHTPIREQGEHGGGVGRVAGVEDGVLAPGSVDEPPHRVTGLLAVRPGAQVRFRSQAEQRPYAVGGDDAGAVRADAACQVQRQVAAQVCGGRDQVAGRESGVPSGRLGRDGDPEPVPVTVGQHIAAGGFGAG